MENRKEISTTDEKGNVWKLIMYKMDTKTNRFQFSFCLNHKEFGLSKLQSARTAEDLWELIESIVDSKNK